MSNIVKGVIGALVAGYAAIGAAVYYVSPSNSPKPAEIVAEKPLPKVQAETQVKPDLGKEPVVVAEAKASPLPVVTAPPLVEEPKKVTEPPAPPVVAKPVDEEPKKLLPKITDFFKKKKVVVEDDEEDEPKKPAPKKVVEEDEPVKKKKVVVESDEPAPKKKARGPKPDAENPLVWSTGKCTSDRDLSTKSECQWARDFYSSQGQDRYNTRYGWMTKKEREKEGD